MFREEPRLVDRPIHLPIPNQPSVINRVVSTSTTPPIIEHQHDRPSSEDVQDSHPLLDNVDKIICIHIPNQAQLDKMMKVIKRKILRDFNLPFTTQQFAMAQQTSSIYKPIYDFISNSILPSDKKAARSITLRAEQYIICNNLIFRLFFQHDGDFVLQLAIPESYIDKLICRYHDSLLASHQGCVRTYLTMRKLFFFPSMFERITSYIRSCSRCQQIKNKPETLRLYNDKIPGQYVPFETLSMDFKSMPTSPSGYKHIMVICCSMTRYLICVPLQRIDAETVCEALIQKVFTLFGIPTTLVTDAGSSLVGKLMTLLSESLGIDHKVISVENHGSLHVERSYLGSNANLIKDSICYRSPICI